MPASCRLRTIDLEFGHGAARLPVRRVLVLRGEEAEGVVAPVVSQAEVQQPLVVHELVYRHQFERGDVQRLEVIDDRRMGQPGVGAAQVLGDAGMGLRHALDVGLVDDCLVIRRERRPVERPVEERVDHHAGHGLAERVDHRRSAGFGPVTVRVDGGQVVGEQRLAEREIAVERLSRMGRAAACSGHTGGRPPDRTGRAPETRSAGPG